MQADRHSARRTLSIQSDDAQVDALLPDRTQLTNEHTFVAGLVDCFLESWDGFQSSNEFVRAAAVRHGGFPEPFSLLFHHLSAMTRYRNNSSRTAK